MENADRIEQIDVGRTLRSLIDDPYGIRAVVMVATQEIQNLRGIKKL